MIAGLILGVSVAALLQFFVSYCRSLIAVSSKIELSADVRQVTGIRERRVPGDDFRRLVQLVDLCPEPGGHGKDLRAVRIYFRMVSLLRTLVRGRAPEIADWADAERQGCAHFAAVALDYRIAYSRDLMAAQISNRL